MGSYGIFGGLDDNETADADDEERRRHVEETSND
jgi:hypothetical protein